VASYLKVRMLKARLALFSPGRLLIISFLFAITTGTILLSLPMAQKVPMSLIDVLFSATSSICVTGLKVVPISSFTFFGQCIILALFQMGGLGLMTLSFFFASLFLNLGMATRLMAGQILEFEFWSKIKNFIALIIGITVVTEFVGFVLLYTQFSKTLPFEDAVFYSFFHSISAFCNAGISLFENSLIDYSTNPAILGIISGLVLAGSIGFIVWYDIAKMIKTFILSLRGIKRFSRPSLHTKLVILATIGLTVFGAIAFFILEYGNLLAPFSDLHKVINATFMSLTARSIGFTTLDLSQATRATLFFLLPFMIIGASPGSTGSGIKTTTFILFVATVRSIIRRRKAVEFFGRTIPTDQAYKVMAILALATFWIFSATLALLIAQPDFSFMSCLFEVVSAFGTCGFSAGITEELSYIGKSIIMITMLTGRIGSLTLVLSLRKKPEKYLYSYPEERIMIG
jgi:trk system potassium uptake protein TrkH